MTALRVYTCLAALLLSVSTAFAQTGSPTPVESPKREKIVMHIVGDNGFIWRGNELVYLHVFDIGGKPVKTITEFKEAIAALPPGTEVTWDSGCIIYTTLPVSGPSTTIKALQQFCTAHGVTFSHVSGY
jgi:hypothetical protein